MRPDKFQLRLGCGEVQIVGVDVNPAVVGHHDEIRQPRRARKTAAWHPGCHVERRRARRRMHAVQTRVNVRGFRQNV